MKTAKQLDHEIAESSLGMLVTADSSIRPGRRVTGIARKIEPSEPSLPGKVLLHLELPNGSHEWVFLENVVPEIPQASARYRKALA